MNIENNNLAEIVRFSEDKLYIDVSIVGGKGASLIRLYRANLQVPDGFVITTDVYKKYNDVMMVDTFKETLLQAFDSLGDMRVAVRSSAVSEDSDTASWAGQFESYMNVDREDLIQRVLDCWRSVKDAAAYAETQGLKQDELVVAVVVQKMIESEVSGVAFSVNPLNHDADEIMIEATYGLGELLVQGMVTPDNYVVSKQYKSVVSSRVVPKSRMLTYHEGENKEMPVSIEIQEKPCLSEEQLLELSTIICQIENFYGSPQDIEWALKDNKFYIVQSRPITA